MKGTIFPDGSVGTGVFASAEDLQRVMVRFNEERTTPVVRVHGELLTESAHELTMQAIDEAAINAGLPPPEKRDGKTVHYGMIGSGEITVESESKEGRK